MRTQGNQQTSPDRGAESGTRYSISIKELPSGERPRERLLSYGPKALSHAELLAIVLRTGTRERSAVSLAEWLLKTHGGLRGVANASVAELCKTKGIGPTKGVQIAACVELGKRLGAYPDESSPTIHSPQEAAAYLEPKVPDPNKEAFFAILLDTKNRAQKAVVVSIGSLDSSVVHPREVFREAISASAASVLVAHNHPSGDPTPSPEDRQVTARLVEAGKLLGIEVIDHLVLGAGRWVSLRECGLM